MGGIWYCEGEVIKEEWVNWDGIEWWMVDGGWWMVERVRVD